MRSPRTLAVALATPVMVLALLPVGVGAQDLETVERRVDELQSSLADATASYEDLRARVETATDELSRLELESVRLEQEVERATEAVEGRARHTFMRGSDDVLTSLLSGDGPQGAIERAALMSRLTDREAATIEAATSLRVQLDQSRALLGDRTVALDALRLALEQEKGELEARLAEAELLAADIRRRDARKRTIQRGLQNGTYACIFERGTTHFVDSWGAPRSGGRSHKGTDVMAAYGAPVYAFTSGRIHRLSTGRLGGISLYLWGDDDNLYYYAHLARYAPGMHVGKRVEAGQLVAFNGDTGNARGGAPHVHYQLHPGGGSPTNPYEWLAAACFS